MYAISILFPALVYLFIIYISAPFKSLSVNNSIKYLIFGMCSPLIVLTLSSLFPQLFQYYFLNHNVPFQMPDGTWTFEPTLFGIFIMNFIQVALFEEMSKFFIFFLLYKNDKFNTNPIQTLFNVVLVSTGFAILENVVYYMRVPSIDIIFVRTFTALILHMVCGVIMGYFIARSNMEFKHKELTNFSDWVTNNPKHKRALFISFGIIASILLHGVYDYDLNMQLGYSPLLLVSSLGLAYYLFRDLKKRVYNLNN